MHSPLLQKKSNGFNTPVTKSKHYDGFYPEAIGGGWNPSDGKDLSSEYSAQTGGYMPGLVGADKTQNYIDSLYRGTQEPPAKSEGKKPQTVPMVREASNEKPEFPSDRTNRPARVRGRDGHWWVLVDWQIAYPNRPNNRYDMENYVPEDVDADEWLTQEYGPWELVPGVPGRARSIRRKSAASDDYKKLAMKFAASVVKTAAISVSQSQDAEGPYMSIKMDGVEYEIRGEAAEKFRQEYIKIPKPEDKVNALVKKYMDAGEVQPAPIQYVPRGYYDQQQPAPAAPQPEQTPAPEAEQPKKPSWLKNRLFQKKPEYDSRYRDDSGPFTQLQLNKEFRPEEEKRPSFKNRLLNRPKYPYIQTLGLDGWQPPRPEPKPRRTRRRPPTGIEKHWREENTPVPAPEAEAYSPKRRRQPASTQQPKVPVGRRRSSLEKTPQVIKTSGLHSKWRSELQKGNLTFTGRRYNCSEDADGVTRRMARLANKEIMGAVQTDNIFKGVWASLPAGFGKDGDDVRGFKDEEGVFLVLPGSNSAYGNFDGGFESPEAAEAFNQKYLGGKYAVADHRAQQPE